MLPIAIPGNHQAAVGYMGEINATAKNDIVKDFRNRNDEMLAKTVKVKLVMLPPFCFQYCDGGSDC